MDNSYFLYCAKNQNLEIERFHICSWEFLNKGPMIEFGFEICNKQVLSKISDLSLYFFIPWYSSSCEIKDLYDNLKDTANSKFIFNDSVTGTKSLDGGNNSFGVIHRFSDRNKLCLLPLIFNNDGDGCINIQIDLKYYHRLKHKPNIYCRFLVKPNKPFLSTQKKGITKSAIIYDYKVNERRNLPDIILKDKREKHFCNIKSCFCFNILPNKYDVVFLDNASLKSVRTLEYESFRKYVGNNTLKKDELIVIFSKKTRAENEKTGSFTFFSMFSKERIGIGQFSMAILLNILCGMLFFIASFRSAAKPNTGFFKVLFCLPYEIYIGACIFFIAIVYFLWPYLVKAFNWGVNLFK